MSRRTKQEIKTDYLQWLESQLRDEGDDYSKSYGDLVHLMFDTAFSVSPLAPMDENRVVDGLDLRVEFAQQAHLSPHTLETLGP